jgi:hypothetical protein
MKTVKSAPGPAAVIIALTGLVLFAPGLGWSAPDGDVPRETSGPVSDAALFARDLRAGGALKFYESTEDLLRAGQFERALLRYAFLKGQIAGLAGYRPLVTMVNQRLHFLQGQLRLPDQELPALKAPPAWSQPPKKKEEARTAPPLSPSAKVPPAPDDKKEYAGLAEGAKSELVSSPSGQSQAAAPQPQETPPKTEDARAEAESAPPPSRWQRLKQRLLFWKK